MHTRKSFVDLTAAERDAFLAAVLTIKHTIANPGAPLADQVSIYDQFVALHAVVMNLRVTGIGSVNYGHNNELFLPWHRQYIKEFESQLQIVDSSVALPYWDWTKRTETRNVLFQDGHVNFERIPLVGIDGDNLYTHMSSPKDIGRYVGTHPANGPPPEAFPGQDTFGPGHSSSTDSLVWP